MNFKLNPLNFTTMQHYKSPRM